jgi:hypothetical protein
LTPPLGRDTAAVPQCIEAAEKPAERAFVIPGISQPVALDAALGAIPPVGEVADFFHLRTAAI